MNFNNPFMNPYMQQFPQMPAPAQTQTQQVIRVSGENGARALQIGPNSSALLLDESGTMVWLCTTDGAGYKTVTAYDIAPHQAAQAPDYGTLENRIKRLEDMMDGYSRNPAAARRSEPDDGTD